MLIDPRFASGGALQPLDHQAEHLPPPTGVAKPRYHAGDARRFKSAAEWLGFQLQLTRSRVMQALQQRGNRRELARRRLHDRMIYGGAQ